MPEEHRDGKSYALGHPSDWQLRAGAHDVGVPGSDRTTDNFGNLIWALHHVWLGQRHTGDHRVLRDVLMPVLAKAVHFYALFLHEGRDGRLHLPRTRSPEYADADDRTYDLSLLRWGVTALLEGTRTLRLDDPWEKSWRDIARRLTPYARHPEQGVMAGKDVPLAESHRHHSHLLWLRDASGRELPWRHAGRGRVTVELSRSGTAVLTPRGSRSAPDPDSGPRDVPALGTSAPWGLPE